MAEPVLQVEELTVAYQHGRIWQTAVRDFSLTVAAGETVGLVGESGSGKSTIALTVMRYLGGNGRVQNGRVLFQGQDLLALPIAQMRPIWGRQMALVPQDPMAALNPSLKIGEQLAEPLRHHLDLDKVAAAGRVWELMEMVRIADPQRVADSYPHQMSGGMQQRVMIALALSLEPTLLVLDEPTTNLDVTTQAAVLELVGDLIRQRQTAVLYVTHNLGVVARICDRVSVLYAGEWVEEAATRPLYRQPWHPYTAGLLRSAPRVGQNKAAIELQAIPGQIPPLGQHPGGCVFASRCRWVIAECTAARPPVTIVPDGRVVRCVRWAEMAAGRMGDDLPGMVGDTAVDNFPTTPVLQLADVAVAYPLGRSLGAVLRRQPAPQVLAVNGVSLTVAAGETLGIVGESGSGKTTLARAIVGLTPRTEGEMVLLGVALPPTVSARSRETLRQLQYVFQNPEEALNPYLTVGQTLQRPLITLLGYSRVAAEQRVAELLTAVQLPPSYAHRLPGQLSGGEKQRVAIARAFAANPELLLADEAVSALDVSVQAAILALLRQLQLENGYALLFISHDLAVVGYLADRIAVVYGGQVMELAAAQTLFQPPYHPYTEVLLAAIPNPDPEAERLPFRVSGDVVSQMERPLGCPFHARCPRSLGEICATQPPPRQTAVDGQEIVCHIELAVLAAAQREGT